MVFSKQILSWVRRIWPHTQHSSISLSLDTFHTPADECQMKNTKEKWLLEALVLQTIGQTGITSCMLYTGWRQGLARVTHQQASWNHMPQTAVMHRSLLGSHKLVLQREKEREREGKKGCPNSVGGGGFSHKTALTQSYNVMPFEIKRGVFSFSTLLLTQNISLKKL